MARVLVVDDEPQLRRALDINLRIRGYEVVLAETGEQALEQAARQRPDLVILDLGLPGIDGVDVIRGLRGWTDIPIIVLTVRDTGSEKVLALDAGADDYVTKPFGLDELLARVRAALRRAAPRAGDEPVVATASFTVDLAARHVHTPTGDVRLTPTEWLIVETLVRNEGRLVTHRQLLDQVWGPTATYDSNLLRVHLAHIRRKLEPDPTSPRHFHTEPGMGYRFVRDDEPTQPQRDDAQSGTIG
jgi:two-component system, OmpR family, KDP operon response regulator KdpE